MRKFLSIVCATALEILSEPLTLLVLLAALSLTVLAPAFHYHQFGEATRMARDAGFSAVFVGGAVIAVFGTIRAFRREVESGTLEMALAHPVSPCGFFLSKTAGAFLSAVMVSATIFFVSVVVVHGAAVGGRLAERTGDIARIWGPCVAVGVAVVIVPLVVGAALNRFVRVRFVLTSILLSLALAAAGAIWAAFRDARTLLPIIPAALPLAFAMALFTSASAAFSFRFRAHAAASLTGLVVLGFLPFVGNYYLAEALSGGGTVEWSYVVFSAMAMLPAVAAFLVLGCRYGEKELAV